MKKSLILVLSFFLLFSFNCATTEQEISKTEESTQRLAEVGEQTVVGDFDLTGIWIWTYDITPTPNCGSRSRETYTVELTQKGDSVTWVDKESGDTGFDKIYGYTMLVPAVKRASTGPSGGTIRIPDRKYKISKDANAITGKYNYTWHGSTGSCEGMVKVTAKRK